MNLRIDLSVIMHKNLVKDIAYFESKPQRFIAFIGPDLRPIRVGKNEYIVKEGEYAHESNNLIYLIKINSVFYQKRQSFVSFKRIQQFQIFRNFLRILFWGSRITF